MTDFFYLRAGLLSAALLLTSAIASPAFAESLPEISPHQIASDVERVQNPDTGAYEYIAPSFDPFEQDRSMAGSASLRSVSAGTTIDGHPIRGGALLDMSFYYNSSSNDPYDTRGFEEAVFVSGDYAPVTLRDNRILECNENVQNVVYYHEDYYRPSLYVNLYRPYRYYSGHYLYDGFRGSRGYNYGRSYSGNRGFGSRSRSRNRIRNTRRNIRNTRRNNRVRETDREDRTDNRRRVNRDTARTRTREERRNARNNRRNRENNREDSRSDRRDRGSATTRQFQRDEAERSNRRDARRNSRAARTANTQTGNLETAARVTPPTGRAENRARAIEKSKNAPKKHSGSKSRRQTQNKNSQSNNYQSKNAQSKNSQSNNRSQTRSQTRSKARGSARSQTRNRVNSKLKLINLLPMASLFSRNVVRNVDVQCAREEMLSIHIPQERLDAARFDGLTVLVLDRAGDEMPVYVPPNYIEGFRRAAGGSVTPNVSYEDPRSTAPVYQDRPSRPAIDSAPCPVGTSKQADGTCLQGGTTSYGGYPTR